LPVPAIAKNVCDRRANPAEVPRQSRVFHSLAEYFEFDFARPPRGVRHLLFARQTGSAVLSGRIFGHAGADSFGDV
jgi:hypothetical protein